MIHLFRLIMRISLNLSNCLRRDAKITHEILQTLFVQRHYCNKSNARDKSLLSIKIIITVMLF